MRVKDYCSAGLRTGSTFLKVIGVLCVLGAILAWFLDGPGWELLGAGIATFLMGVLFKGLYPLSCLAEYKLAELGDTDFREEDKEAK